MRRSVLYTQPKDEPDSGSAETYGERDSDVVLDSWGTGEAGSKQNPDTLDAEEPDMYGHAEDDAADTQGGEPTGYEQTKTDGLSYSDERGGGVPMADSDIQVLEQQEVDIEETSDSRAGLDQGSFEDDSNSYEKQAFASGETWSHENGLTHELNNVDIALRESPEQSMGAHSQWGYTGVDQKPNSRIQNEERNTEQDFGIRILPRITLGYHENITVSYHFSGHHLNAPALPPGAWVLHQFKKSWTQKAHERIERKHALAKRSRWLALLASLYERHVSSGSEELEAGVGTSLAKFKRAYALQ
eukprot:scaffold625_cov420-Prasinococcus_capsulatus_cf.AAC.23